MKLSQKPTTYLIVLIIALPLLCSVDAVAQPIFDTDVDDSGTAAPINVLIPFAIAVGVLFGIIKLKK